MLKPKHGILRCNERLQHTAQLSTAYSSTKYSIQLNRLLHTAQPNTAYTSIDYSIQLNRVQFTGVLRRMGYETMAGICDWAGLQTTLGNLPLQSRLPLFAASTSAHLGPWGTALALKPSSTVLD